MRRPPVSRPGTVTYRFKGRWRGATRRAVLERQGGRCALCPAAGTDGQGKGLNLAHLVAHDKGGIDHEDNLVALCAPCHRAFDSGAKAPAGRPPGSVFLW